MNNENRSEQWLKTMNRRYAAKYFDENKHIAEKDWQTIIETGRLSPSSMGLEPWQFFDIKNEQLKARIGQVAWGLQRQLPGLDHLLLVATRKHMTPEDAYLKRFVTEFKGYDYPKFAAKLQEFQQHDMDMHTERAVADWSRKQSYIAQANMMTAAAFLGIDSCPIEGFNYQAVDDLMDQAGIYDPTELTVSYMIAFGYATTSVKPKQRRPLDQVYKEIN